MRFFTVRIRWFTIAAMAVLIAGAMTGSSQATPVSGGGDGCNPGYASNYATYYFDGMDSANTGGTPGGVYATIRNYSPYVDPNSDAVSEWVMLDVQPPSASQYVQIGWWEAPGGDRKTFVEYSLGPGAYNDSYSAPYPINSNQTYGVLYQPGNQYAYVLTVNGQTVYDYPNFFTPGDAQIFAELHSQESQEPGGYNNNGNEVYNAYVWPKAGSNNGWQNFDRTTTTGTGTETTGNGPSWAGETPWKVNGANYFYTWDKRCPH